MIYLEERHRQIIDEILLDFPYKVSVYGSRAKGTHRKLSDIDLCVFGNPFGLELFFLKDAFEESDLPIKVDVVVWDKLSSDFQNLIKSDLQPIKNYEHLKIIYLVHNTTTDNEKGLVSGHFDCDLSEKGFMQAKKQHHFFRQAIMHQGKIFSSNLLRARRTAEIIFENKEVTSDTRLNEIDYGKFTHHPKAEIDAMKNLKVDEAFESGESYRDVQARMQAFLEQQIFPGTITIVAHQAPQLALEVICNKKSWNQAFEQDWRNDGNWQSYWVYRFLKT